MQPRITIGIPTLGARPDRLQKAIASALGQSVPCRVLVADQNPEGDGPATRAARRFHGHPHVRHVHTGAASLWDNWTLAAESCETPHFMWLQDDDLISPFAAERASSALDRFGASCWMAYLAPSTYDGLGNRWDFCGPMLPMDLILGAPRAVPADWLLATCYFTSPTLSPAFAFRVGPDTLGALRAMPPACDLFYERLVPAALSALGPAVADPMVAGYWVQHEGNESRRQHDDAPRQFRLALAELDRLADGRDLVPALVEWTHLLGPARSRALADDTARFAGDSPVLDALRGALDGLAVPSPAEPEPDPEPASARRKQRKGA